MHLALYRRFRPQTFDEVIGQEHIVSTLVNQVKTGKISHAYLFTGSRGTGKTSCAKIFARAINCLNPIEGSPCGKCDNCVALKSSNNVDIFEIDAASNNGVNEIRELRETVKYPPVNGKYKVYIIDEVHMLTDSAFNALLKTLEEPPEHVVFILATTEAYKLPATILSRCMRFDFRLVSVVELKKLLKSIFDKCQIKYDEQSVEAISLAGDGSVRDMLSIADCVVGYCQDNITYEKTMKILGASDKGQVYSLMKSVIDKNLGNILETISEIYESGKNLTSLCKELEVCFKNLIVIKSCNDARDILKISEEEFLKLSNLAQMVSVENLITYMQKFGEVELQLKYAISPKTLIELACLECASIDNVKKN